MARIKTEHRAGLDFLDQVLFHDLVVHIGMDCWERGQLETVISRVKEMVDARCTGRDVEVITHLVYYFLEISLANTFEEWRQAVPFKLPDLELPKETVAAISEYKKVYQCAWMLAVSKLSTGVDSLLALQIAEALSEEFAEYSPLVRRDLVRRCFAYEFRDSSLLVYCWLLKTGVLPVKNKKQERLSSELSEKFVTRLSLLAEFDSLMHTFCLDVTKKNIIDAFLEQKKQLNLQAKTVKRILDIESAFKSAVHDDSLRAAPLLYKRGELQNSSDQVQSFFKKLGMRKMRFRMHNGSLRSWLGVLGASLVAKIHVSGHENAAFEQHTNGSDIVSKSDLKVPAIFSAMANEGTITDIAKNRLSIFGFTISSDTLYRTHSAMKEITLYMIRLYCNATREMGVVMPNYYDDPHYGAIFIHADRLVVNAVASTRDERCESDT